MKPSMPAFIPKISTPFKKKEVNMPLCGDDHAKVMARINRIEGQVRGLKKMVEADRDCLQVLKQIAAAGGALRSLGAVILEDHLKGCVATALRTKENEQYIRTLFISMGRTLHHSRNYPWQDCSLCRGHYGWFSDLCWQCSCCIYPNCNMPILYDVSYNG